MVREQVLAEGTLPGAQHAVPETCASEGCGWPTAHSFALPKAWRSGLYEVTMRVADAGGIFTHRGKRTAESVLSFVVRSPHPGRDTKVLLQLSTNSWAAYNNYGGFSVYGCAQPYLRPSQANQSVHDGVRCSLADSTGSTECKGTKHPLIGQWGQDSTTPGSTSSSSGRRNRATQSSTRATATSRTGPSCSRATL
eukprot:SAG31_NODE_4618_length_3092_cov_2.884731_2_plen_195_part_00